MDSKQRFSQKYQDWPTLFSWEHEGITEADHWFCLATAYLDSSKQLLQAIINQTLGYTYFHAQVVDSLFTHSIELFLKGAIVQAGRRPPNTHDLNRLYNSFKNLYPGKIYEFEGSIADVVHPSSQTPHNQFSRYPTDRSGQLWPGSTHYSLSIWSKQIMLFSKDFERIKPLVKERYPEQLKS